MDTLIASALEEICSRGPGGLTLTSLWSVLTPTPSLPLKSALWSNLLSVPSLQFTLPGKDTPLSPTDVTIRRFEDAERLCLKIAAKEQLRDCFVGLYDTPSSGISAPQLRALERLASARTDGIAQNQLAKEFGIEGKNLFYIVRNLESRGLIVRQPAVVKTTEAGGEGEGKNSWSVTTNLMYLYRYAKHLGIQQRLEINKEGRSLENVGDEEEYGGEVVGDGLRDEVLVMDYLPALKAICDKLDEVNEKVLVMSDIKRDLGYTGTRGHRSWRNVCRRLKDAGLVEEFEAKVNGKVERCLRLLKKFSPREFESKTIGCGENCDSEQMIKFGRISQPTEQLVELPIDHQIYDMIDAEGSEGATVMEVCGRLGLDKKRNYPRFQNMVSRFGMHLQAENHKRTVAFRVWTSRTCNSEASNVFQSKSKIPYSDNNLDLDVGSPHVSGTLIENFVQNDYPTSKVDNVIPEDPNIEESEPNFYQGSQKDVMADDVANCPGKETEPNAPRGSTSSPGLDLANMEVGTHDTSSQITSTLSNLPSSLSHQMYPYMPLTSDGALREQRILQRLEDEKFILRSELHRWLVSFEKEKCTTMDRKTIDRILNKLQQQGRCRCVHINVPVVTNCGRSRITMVILHPSIQGFPPELMGEIHDRLRSFEKEVRRQGSSWRKNNESVPVLNEVVRSQMSAVSDENAAKSEAMRTNGFVLAKMVRAKLLHRFIWDYVRSIPGWDEVLSSGKDTCTYKLFALEEAVKAIPVELFLQVAGSTNKFDDMLEKCQKSLRLCDLPVEEYKSLMDTRATGRLSVIVDILRRLKLIRLVHGGHSEEGSKVRHAKCTHAIELKPYLEEPLSVYSTFNLRSSDLRPRIRHDFILSEGVAVDEYWKILEYCYAATDPKAALHAFPGSAVPEVFLQKSWTSLRVMSADQRAELLKRVAKDHMHRKISYKECEKIAKDLNLSLQQVLRVYYDKYQQRLSGFQSVVDTNREDFLPSIRKGSESSKKRKKYMQPSSVNCSSLDSANEEVVELEHHKLPGTGEQFEKGDLYTSGDQTDHFPMYQEDVQPNIVGEQEPDDDGECYSVISQYANSKMKPSRKGRFSWTDEADRQLVIQYARHRAVLGAKFHRIDWNSLPNLPAPPKNCARRMASLNRNTKFRKAVMKLCTMLSERFVKHLEKGQNMPSNDNRCRVLVSSVEEGPYRRFSGTKECVEGADFTEETWDDFNQENIKKAFEDVLLWKRMAKLDASKRFESSTGEWSNLNTNSEGYNHGESESVPRANLNEDTQNLGRGRHKDSLGRSRFQRLHEKFTKLLSKGTNISRQVHRSVAVSNAVELLKLVFLSTSTAPELQNLLSETLRRYSERDLFTAFSYLREKRIMIGGDGGQPFLLSQQFLHSVSKSQFPVNTGKRAANFSNWLYERHKELTEVGISLYANLHCGDIFQLFALVSSGELSISPCLPDDGVGEAEDFRNLKRKADDDDLSDDNRVKKLKSLADSELISRREKGFPGISVSVQHATISTIDTVELFKDGDTIAGEPHWSDILGKKIVSCSSNCDLTEEVPNLDSIIPAAEWSSKSPWEAMADYAEYQVPVTKQVHGLNPEVFKAIYAAIQMAGDQGLSTEEVSHAILPVFLSGVNMQHECAIDILQVFGWVLKVNAFESVRIVDSLYRSKYFLTTGFHQELTQHPVKNSICKNNDLRPISQPLNLDVISGSSKEKVILGDNNVHKVTILNLPEDALALDGNQSCSTNECGLLDKNSRGCNDERETLNCSSGGFSMPILPWINGDGTINRVIYDGLVRRVFGIVMQNPGMLEDDIILRLDVLNPQSCRSLLELMILDKHLIVRNMIQSTSNGPPPLLGTLLGRNYKESNLVYRKHFFANLMRPSLL
ncbi:hypothetical protein K2173_024531 [Erythroxylum novogranatense]|uniref:B-block binding subunit of TFIIIC n=1 Tax=Erythroxylum novogranatense TaxID=1862640 RepID=A0AAV8SVF0_9ROSI|nr:hypothetical protein K2173_024531 [Erythroxylum novogranatense]